MQENSTKNIAIMIFILYTPFRVGETQYPNLKMSPLGHPAHPGSQLLSGGGGDDVYRVGV